MRDVDDVENAEGDRDAGGDGRIEAAEQQPGNDGIDQELDGKAHGGGPLPMSFRACCSMAPRRRQRGGEALANGVRPAYLLSAAS